MLKTGAKKVQVSISCGNEQHRITAIAGEYRSLMQLICDKIYVEDFGDCLGMGKCCTCLVEITSTVHPLGYYDRNGGAALRKAGRNKDNVMLACQVIADESIDGLEAAILTT